MDVTKPYEFIGFGAMDVTKPYEFIGSAQSRGGPDDSRVPRLVVGRARRAKADRMGRHSAGEAGGRRRGCR